MADAAAGSATISMERWAIRMRTNGPYCSCHSVYSLWRSATLQDKCFTSVALTKCTLLSMHDSTPGVAAAWPAAWPAALHVARKPIDALLIAEALPWLACWQNQSRPAGNPVCAWCCSTYSATVAQSSCSTSKSQNGFTTQPGLLSRNTPHLSVISTWPTAHQKGLQGGDGAR
eukprot:GHRR01015438.1.p1 GENE.GHRR01015438.1~~GHRR01015438.1.p1  ORF type:complete len:173 (-),score=39.80 GHRR01015438.1:478-996(-)